MPLDHFVFSFMFPGKCQLMLKHCHLITLKNGMSHNIGFMFGRLALAVWTLRKTYELKVELITLITQL